MKTHRQDILCWLCDYWLILLGILMVAATAWTRSGRGLVSTPPPIQPSPLATETFNLTPTPLLLTMTASPNATQVPMTNATSPILPSVTPSDILTEKPEFIMAAIPVMWTGSDEDFADAATQQINFFIQESGMDAFFRVKIELVESGMDNVSLSDEQLVVKLIEFGLNEAPANRYIGITDGDLALDGSSDVAGWTYGPDTLGIIAETGSIEIVAHELGHTFGLCDEYNYDYWVEQDEAFTGGCPNPFPPECERTEGMNSMCEGNPTIEGLYSIMGPSGLPGGYGFNSSSFEHLQEAFRVFSVE